MKRSASLRSAFTLDLRSLAISRFFLGLLAFLDVVHKSFWARAFFSDQGVMPRSLAIEKFSGLYATSLYFIQGTTGFVLLLMGLQAFFALAYMVGWKTRQSNILLFALVASLGIRNKFILSGGDDLLRVALFWTIFLPMGARFSCDALRRGVPEKSDYFGVSTVAFVLQILFVYIFTAAMKTGPTWRADFSAVYLVLRSSLESSALGVYVSQFYGLTQVLTAFTIGLEIFGPLVYFFGGWGRLSMVVSFVLLHLGMSALLLLGKFPFVCIACWLALLPSSVWAFGGGRRLLFILRRTERLLFSPLSVESVFNRFLVSLSLILVLVLNLSSILPWIRLPHAYNFVVGLFNIGQRWTMFSPDAIRGDTWLLIEGKFDDGKTLDLWMDQPVEVSRSEASNHFINIQWRRFKEGLLEPRSPLLDSTARYYCRVYSRHESVDHDLTTVVFHTLSRRIEMPGEVPEPAADTVIWTESCRGG